MKFITPPLVKGGWGDFNSRYSYLNYFRAMKFIKLKVHKVRKVYQVFAPGLAGVSPQRTPALGPQEGLLSRKL